MNKWTLWAGALIVFGAGALVEFQGPAGSGAMAAFYTLTWMGVACK